MKQNLRLFLNSLEVDLSANSDIAFTFQINNLADVQNQSGNTTNQFQLPLTQRNRAILGFPDDIIATTQLPYTRFTAKFIQNGYEIIGNGVAFIDHVENKTVFISVVSGNFDFFDSISGQIYDMGDSTSVITDYGKILVWKPYDHIWNVANAASSQTKTSGWIWPVVDYGGIDLTDFSKPLNVRNQRPGFFIHTFIELLCQSAGYSIDVERSSLMKDPLYKKLIAQFSNGSFDHGSDYQNTPDTADGFSTVMATRTVIDNTVHYTGALHFNPNGLFDGTYYNNTKNINGTVYLNFDCLLAGILGTSKPSVAHIYLTARLRSDGSVTALASIDITLDNNATVLDKFVHYAYEQFLNQKLAFDVELTPDIELYIGYSIDHSTESTFIMNAGATLSFVVNTTTILWSQAIQCERIMPPVSQKDLLKCILQKFAVVCQSNNITRQVTFASFRDIYSNKPIAKDWTSKYRDMGNQNYFDLGNYDQINWMRYQYDDSIPAASMPKYFADDKILINNKTLNPQNPQQDLINSVFSPSINRPYLGGTIAKISNPDNTDAFSVGNEPRILVDQKLNLQTIGKTVTFADNDPGFITEQIVVNDIISIPYFFKPAGDYNLCFCDKDGQPGLRTTYYKEVERILTNTKKVIRFFKLTARDIHELDMLIPVYVQQLGGYFYINKIDSWKKDQPTKVELVRLG
jgi:hypothetical protein